MNKIAFGDMSAPKKRNLYECLWGSEAFDFPVEKTIFKGVPSNDSYTFTNASTTNEDVCRNRLAELFGIKDPDLFTKKFAQSCHGSGQELKNLPVLHSSSLCALLFFYHVSEENPYMMEMEGEKYIFTASYFEYQNPVIDGRTPSNVDVVLVGTNKKSGKQAVCFLESKFSEYYEHLSKQSQKIAAAYLDNSCGKTLYSKDSLDRMGLEIEYVGDTDFILRSKETCYLDGIKQMISHYIGVRNLCNDPGLRDDVIAHAIAAGAKVLLGEILFTKGIGQLSTENGEDCVASYQKKYCILADILNEQLKKEGMNGRISVLGDLLSYSQFQDKPYIQEPQIKRFYFELGK